MARRHPTTGAWAGGTELAVDVRGSMSVRDKWLVGIGALLTGLAMAVLLVYWLLLPAFVERAMRAALQQRGLDEATFSLESMTLSSLELQNLKLDNARTLTIGRVEVDYTLADLLAGQVHEVRLINAQWQVHVSGDYDVDWGAAAKLIAGPGKGPPPIAQVRWIRSRVLVHAPDRTVSIPIDGTATLAGLETQLDLRGELFDERFHLHASANAQERTGQIWATLRGPARGEGPRDSIAATARYATPDGKQSVDIEVRGQRASVHAQVGERDWALADLRGRLHVQLTGDEVMAADGDISASAVSSGDIQLLEPRFAIERIHQLLALEVSARVEDCNITVGGTLSPRPGEWNAAGPFDGAWHVEGALPSSLDEALANAGVRSDKPRIETARGRSLIVRTRSGWQGELLDASATVAANTLALPQEGLSIRRPRVAIRFYARMDQAGGEVALRKDSEISARALRWKTLSFRGARSASPAVRVRMEDDTTVVGWNRESLWWRSGNSRTILSANVRYGEAIDVTNLRGTLRASIAQRATGLSPRIRSSTLRADRVRVGTYTIPAVSARIRGRPTRLSLEARAELTKSATVSVETTLTGQGKRQRCPVKLELPQARIEKDDLLDKWIGGLAPVRLAGTVTLSARMDPCAPNLEARGHVGLANVTVRHESGTLEGLDGTLAFESVEPLRTSGWQTLKWTKTMVGERSLGSGSVVFRSGSPGVFEVQEAQLDVGGGALRTSGFLVDPKALDIETTVYARKVSVKTWLPIVSRGKAQGTGTLSGQLGIRFRRTPQLQLRLSSGHLSSDAGGRFMVRDRTWLLQALQRYSAGFGLAGNKSDLIKDRLIGALMDFDYTALAMRITRQHPPVLQLTARGKGRRIPQELDLTVNVRGFEEAINPALRAWLANKE